MFALIVMYVEVGGEKKREAGIEGQRLLSTMISQIIYDDEVPT